MTLTLQLEVEQTAAMTRLQMVVSSLNNRFISDQFYNNTCMRFI